MKLRLLALDDSRPPARLLAEGTHRAGRHLCPPQRLPDPGNSGRNRRHHLVQSVEQRRGRRDRRHRDDHQPARQLPRDGRPGRVDDELRRGRHCAATRRRRARSCCLTSMSCCRPAAEVVGQAARPGRPQLRRRAAIGRRLAARPWSASTAARRSLPADVRAILTAPRKAGDAERSGRSADRSHNPRGRRQRDVRASRRLPADRAAAALQRRRARPPSRHKRGMPSERLPIQPRRSEQGRRRT